MAVIEFIYIYIVVHCVLMLIKLRQYQVTSHSPLVESLCNASGEFRLARGSSVVLLILV